ncbi:MAG: carbohydrate ABC transporter substrate-binding protein [Clostridiales bacterium]|nr:carbohydrate ABC transporter substrate-binding protein [Clostridiales bacterium]
MKKIIASVLCFAMVAGVAGCDSKDETTKATQTTAATTSAAAETTTTAGEAEETTAATNTTANVEYGSGSIVIKVYAMSAEVPNMLGAFMKQFPDMAAKYKIDAMYCNNDGQGYETKLNQALKAQEDGITPDIYIAEADYILPYTQGAFSEYAASYKDFIDDVDNKVKDAEIAGYTVDLGSKDGELKALCYQCTGGAFIYRRSIAKDVFGSDDQKTVEDAIGAGTQKWDKFFEACAALKAKGYKMVSGLSDIWVVSEKCSQTPWVVDGKLNIDPARSEYIDIAKKMIDEDYTNDTSSWSEAWYSDMIDAGESKVFGWFGPAWLINYVLADKCQSDNINVGDYAVCVPPVGFWWGGSWLLASKLAVENADKKEFVSKFIEWVTLDTTKEGLQYGWANNSIEGLTAAKDTVSSGKVMKVSDGTMTFLGGQNPFQIFVDATSYASSKCKCEYDADLNGTWQDLVNQYAHGKISKDDITAKFNDAAEAIDIEV